MSVLAMAGGTRDFLLGLGFLAGWEQITRTLIYQNYDELVPGVSGQAAGIMFIIAGLIVNFAAIKGNRKWMALALNIQAFAWMFSTLMYLLNGHYLLGAIFGVFFTFPAGYKAYYIKNHASIDAQLRELLGKDWRS